ncbi:enoyl-CoA hydratase/isomerase family protein [Ancylobacter mangrovi]|uniref:Enoyl-CoA hydratase/isomerase family protein n=1 Tax=Ancylobacter mangrovi TaxID=2972472 RepID=A0A9X2T1K2_9HYPH|nr:enoyl-CoA hydratase/isomerase family protein [Ancylobacter mangrovi]MCS0494782.1 enoyl-CoA hydratase/isomerase family protein [Ancylobacter mangrovi]MCS0502173.1 enoyl-CoA hydratase/isomerase family protein [Ancylobacter mangrovi]
MTYQHLIYDVEDRVATITLNRPDRHNALSQPLVDEIIAVMKEVDADPEVRVAIITGAGGKAFSSGYDIKESAELPKRSLADWRARMHKDITFTYSVWDCSKPVIAMVDGFCFAGALEFAMCCDMRYCSDVSKFAAIEARFSAGIATMIMPWLLGQRSRALIYSGDTIDAEEAFRLGLVDKVFPKADVAAEVRKIALRMSRVSMECLKANKRAINQSFEIMGLRNAIEYGAEICASMDAVGSPEAETFDTIRRSEGLSAALKWRAEQFAPFE